MSQPKIAIKVNKTSVSRLRSSKVIDFGAKQKPVYDDLLLVINIVLTDTETRVFQ